MSKGSAGRGLRSAWLRCAVAGMSIAGLAGAAVAQTFSDVEKLENLAVQSVLPMEHAGW